MERRRPRECNHAEQFNLVIRGRSIGTVEWVWFPLDVIIVLDCIQDYSLQSVCGLRTMHHGVDVIVLSGREGDQSSSPATKVK